MKKMIKYVTVSFTLFALAAILYNISTSYDLENHQDLIRAVNEGAAESNQNLPLAVSYRENYAAILFCEPGESEVVIMKKVPFTNRYRHWGAASTQSDIGTYQIVDYPDHMVVVYGDNSTLGATSYVLSNGSETLSQNNLKPYILDIYLAKGNDSEVFTGSLYDGAVLLENSMDGIRK